MNTLTSLSADYGVTDIDIAMWLKLLVCIWDGIGDHYHTWPKNANMMDITCKWIKVSAMVKGNLRYQVIMLVLFKQYIYFITCFYRLYLNTLYVVWTKQLLAGNGVWYVSLLFEPGNNDAVSMFDYFV